MKPILWIFLLEKIKPHQRADKICRAILCFGIPLHKVLLHFWKSNYSYTLFFSYYLYLVTLYLRS